VTSPTTASPAITTVIFDLGGVLIDWNPRYLFRDLFNDDARMERFLAEVCSPIWNIEQDAGRPFEDAVAHAVEHHPEFSDMVRAYHDRWPETLGGPIAGTVAILDELHGAGVPLYALTNWSGETFHHARARFEFLALFEGILVSGDERLVKPDPRIYHRLLQRYGLDPKACVFIDDSPPNVLAAQHYFAMSALRFTDPETLRADLVRLGLPLAEEES